MFTVMLPFIGKLMNWCGMQLLPGEMVDFFKCVTLEAMELRKKSSHVKMPINLLKLHTFVLFWSLILSINVKLSFI